MTPRELILKIMEAACGDACCENTLSNEPLFEFDKINKCEIVDIKFNPRTGVFTLEVDGDVVEETLKLGLEVEVIKARHDN